METINDSSYGVVPIRKTESGWKVLLINQHSRIGDNTYWTLPKGHPTGNETPLKTAVRELYEETGLVAKELMPTPEFTMQYKFTFEEKLVDKTVTFFIGIVTETTPRPDGIEAREADWFTLREAEQRLAYENAKTLFRQIRKYIEEKL